jgi:tRNA U34 5-methylaminomethyl-2-thiouridine-forming methyltransferase MnmC
MQRQLILTADGSHSIAIPEMNVTYHSVHGAIQESRHVFIEAGLGSGRFHRPETHNQSASHSKPESINILEMGFGTGLNALLTYAETEKRELHINFTTIELFPLQKEEFQFLNYCEAMGRTDLQSIFTKMHDCDWEKDTTLSPRFTLFKTNQSLLQFKSERPFDLIYFDAFDPAAQPELWTKEVFALLFANMNPQAVLVTYCCKGDVRRAMQAAGFVTEKIPGPPRKREMLRATKP